MRLVVGGVVWVGRGFGGGVGNGFRIQKYRVVYVLYVRCSSFFCVYGIIWG